MTIGKEVVTTFYGTSDDNKLNKEGGSSNLRFRARDYDVAFVVFKIEGEG